MKRRSNSSHQESTVPKSACPASAADSEAYLGSQTHRTNHDIDGNGVGDVNDTTVAERMTLNYEGDVNISTATASHSPRRKTNEMPYPQHNLVNGLGFAKETTYLPFHRIQPPGLSGAVCPKQPAYSETIFNQAAIRENPTDDGITDINADIVTHNTVKNQVKPQTQAVFPRDVDSRPVNSIKNEKEEKKRDTTYMTDMGEVTGTDFRLNSCRMSCISTDKCIEFQSSDRHLTVSTLHQVTEQQLSHNAWIAQANISATPNFNSENFDMNAISVEEQELQKAIMQYLQCSRMVTLENNDKGVEDSTNVEGSMQSLAERITRGNHPGTTYDPCATSVTKCCGSPTCLSSDEMDGVCAVAVHGECLSHAPDNIPQYYTDSSASTKAARSATSSSFLGWIFHNKEKPDHVSEVYIKHPMSTDNATLGDRFGATLKTYRWKKGDKSYYQHFLTDIKGDSPAHAMKIEDSDEFVLLNEVFVPAACHSDVLQIFSKVKVDTHTRLTLILRRPDTNGQQRKWKWYKTSAILIPELDKEPRVKEPEYEPVANWYDHQAWIRLHVWNDPSLYLTVTQHDVTVEKLVSPDDHDPRDNCRKICAWRKVLQDPKTGLLNRYVISMFGYAHDPVPYVAICGVESGVEIKDVAVLPGGEAPVPGQAVVSKDRAFWFDYKKMGEEMYITYNDKYLGKDRTSGKVGLHTENQYFVLRPTDTPCASIQSLASGNSSCDFTDFSNSSSTSGSMEWDSSTASDITDQDSPMSSQESNSSGYATSSPRVTNRRITRSMSRQQTVSTPLSNLSLE